MTPEIFRFQLGVPGHDVIAAEALGGVQRFVGPSDELERAFDVLVLGVEYCDADTDPEGERTPVLIYDGEPTVGELSSLESAAKFSAQGKAATQNEILKIQSDTEGGWLIGVQCGPSRIPLDMQTSDAFQRRAEDDPGRTDSPVVCWIGLRFVPEDLGGSQESAAFRLLGADDGDLGATGGEQGLVSLLDLGGVLAWYARQISSILDDPVTGLAGRAEFQASLNHAFELARQSGRPLGLLFINPDDFTTVNENNGHEAGVRVLREIGERLRKTHRVSDAIAKYGGAIFASFLPDTPASSARIVAEKIWSRLSETKYLDGAVRLGWKVQADRGRATHAADQRRISSKKSRRSVHNLKSDCKLCARHLRQ